MLDRLAKIIESSGNRSVLATVCSDGGVHLAPEYVVDLGPERISLLKVPNSQTITNVEAHPFVSLSIVDWVQRDGIQLKGVATVRPASTLHACSWPQHRDRLLSAGCTNVIDIEICEAYAIAPAAGLNRPTWQRHPLWKPTKKLPPFQAPATFPNPVDRNVQQKLMVLTARLLDTRTPVFVGTRDVYGIPNISPRFLLDIDPDCWLFGDAFRNKTFLNVTTPSPVSIAAIDWADEEGWLAQGWCRAEFRGEWLRRVKERWQQVGFSATALQAVRFFPAELHELALNRRRQVATLMSRDQWLKPPTATRDGSAT